MRFFVLLVLKKINDPGTEDMEMKVEGIVRRNDRDEKHTGESPERRFF